MWKCTRNTKCAYKLCLMNNNGEVSEKLPPLPKQYLIDLRDFNLEDISHLLDDMVIERYKNLSLLREFNKAFDYNFKEEDMSFYIHNGRCVCVYKENPILSEEESAKQLECLSSDVLYSILEATINTDGRRFKDSFLNYVVYPEDYKELGNAAFIKNIIQDGIIFFEGSNYMLAQVLRLKRGLGWRIPMYEFLRARILEI